MEDEQVPVVREEADPKRPWEPPVIEELDFSATEATYIPGTPIDLGFYTA